MLSAFGVGDTSGSSNSSGQSLEDKLYAVKYFISGQCLSFVVLKATTSEILGPKRKHLNYLVTITNEPNVSIPDLVKYLMKRAKHCEWSVVFKSLITIHYLMSYGNEKFIQNLASSTVNHRSFEYLSSFVDRTTTKAYDMSTFLRRYSRYVNVKIHTYRSLGMDFCKIKKSNESPLKMREMQSDQLMKILPILQNQFDTLLAFDASSRDLNNGIINSAFAMLYKDFVKLYICYQAAIIRLLELYFKTTQVKRAQEFLHAYKKFLVRMDKVSDFMRVIDSVGIDKSDMPNLSRSPSLPLSAIEKYLANLESATLSRRNYQAVNELPKIRSDYATLTKQKRTSSIKLPTPTNNDICIPRRNSIKSREDQIKQQGKSSTLTDSDIGKLVTYDKRKKDEVEDCDKGYNFNSIYSTDSKADGSHRYIDDLFLAELTENATDDDDDDDLTTKQKTDEKEKKMAETINNMAKIVKDKSEDLILMYDPDEENISSSETTTNNTTTTTTTSCKNRKVTPSSSNNNNKPPIVGTHNDWVQVEL